MANSSRSGFLLGVPVESRAWPAAFATMTAIAASLFIALLVRPNTIQLPTSMTTGSNTHRPAPLSIELQRNQEVLAVRDAHSDNFETRLAGRATKQASQDFLLHTFDNETSVLTPGSWQQLIGDPKSGDPTGSGAFAHPRNQGVNS
jgi:hypothetical protein